MTEQKPLISVIVPIYKAEQYLDKCVQSIVDQTYRNLEILLVDDGSPDSCPMLCDSWASKDSRIKVIHKKNEGQEVARNIGLDSATGSFIAFVDSDDWIASDMYEYLYSNLVNANADISACQATLVYPDGKYRHTQEFSPRLRQGDAAHALILVSTDVMGHVVWDKLYKAELFTKIRFPDVPRDGDMFVTYRILDNINQFVFAPQPKYYYRQHDDSLAHSDKPVVALYVDACREMVALVQRKYPETVPYAYLDFITHCVWAFEQIARIGMPDRLQPTMKLYRQEISRNYKYVCNNVDPTIYKISLAERTRWFLISVYPKIFLFLYAIFLRLKKRS